MDSEVAVKPPLRADGERRRVLMLCAHEPTADPRVVWEASGAAQRFDVAVLGFSSGDGAFGPVEKADGYTLYRLPHKNAGIGPYARRLLEGVDAGERTVLLVVGAVALLPLAVIELVFRGLLLCHRALRRAFPSIAASLQGLRTALLAAVAWSRIRDVLGVLRVQFAPATAQFWRFVRNLPRKPDVIHCNDLDTLLVGVLARKHFGCTLVYDAHEYFPHSDPEGGWLDRVVFHFLENALIRKADAVITVNHQLAEVIRDAYGLSEVRSLPNAVPWSGTQAAMSTDMTALASGRVKFLFQGRFSPQRGLEELVDAWSRIDATRAALFLRGPDNAWRQELRARAERLGILGRSVYFLDAVRETQLVAAAMEADVGVIAYKGDVAGYKYACPNKLSQYLHAGLMVLTNDLPYVREVIEDAGAGLHYSSADPDSIVGAVSRISGDAGLLRESKENALRYARASFNWQRVSPVLYDIYADPSAQKPRASSAAPGRH